MTVTSDSPKHRWLVAWRRQRSRLRQNDPQMAPRASYSLAVREHHGARLTRVEDYRHRRALGQHPAQALAGAAKHAPKRFRRDW